METTLPNFLCIGAPKCGSTWLQKLLETHPNVFIPTELNEIHFFDDRFDQGLGWYQNFFSEKKAEHTAVGEITPHYLYTDPSRIKTIATIEKLILIYRDPVDRIVSHYKFRARVDGYQGTFPQFLVDYPQAIEWSRYGQHLQKYLSVFDRNQFLIMRFEDATKNVEQSKRSLASFLNLDPGKFPSNAGSKVVNEGFQPKHRWLYSTAVKTGKWLADRGLYGVRNRLKNSFLHKFLRSPSSSKQEMEIDETLLQELRKQLDDDWELFQSLIA